MTAESLAGATVYAVDDEVDNLDLIARALRSSYRVVAFEDPLRALKTARTDPPDIVLADYRMPNLDGVRFVRALREAGIACAALLVTAYADLPDVVQAQKDELIFRVIPKPWNAAELRAHVEVTIRMFRFRSTPPAA